MALPPRENQEKLREELPQNGSAFRRFHAYDSYHSHLSKAAHLIVLRDAVQTQMLTTHVLDDLPRVRN